MAIIFSGRITAYEHCTGLDDLYERYDCTSFCSLNKTATNEYLNTFFRKYNIGPSQINFEKTIYPEWLFKLKKHPWTKHDNVYSALYHNKRAFDLIKPYIDANKVKFDVVLFYRADIDAKEPLILVKPVKNTVYIPDRFYGGHPEGFLEQLQMTPQQYGTNATLAYGSYKNMEIYCGIVDRLHEICVNNSIDYHHERLIMKGLELAHVKVHLFNYEYVLHPRRYNSHYNLS